MIQNNDLELNDHIAKWCAEVLPEQHNHGYTIEALVDDRHVSVRSEDQLVAYPCGCVQDMFLCALAYELSRSGDIDLSEFVGSYLPELNIGTGPGRSVRVADLLCQAAGQQSPRPNSVAAAHATWSNFTDYLTSGSPRFPPGTVVDHGFVERIILVRILTQALRSDPYTIILRRFFDGLDVHALPSDRVGLLDIYTYPADLLKAVKRLLDGSPEFLRAATAQPRLGTAKIFSSDRVTKGFVPVLASFGMLSFGSGYWGQNGASSDGYLAVRFDESRKAVVVGFSPHKRLRDLSLNQVCHRLSSSRGYDPKSTRIGYLNGFLPDQLVGTYDRGSWGTVTVSYEGAVLTLDFTGVGGRLQCKVLPDGYLRTAFSVPSLWIEPFIHPSEGTTCISIGGISCVRLDLIR